MEYEKRVSKKDVGSTSYGFYLPDGGFSVNFFFWNPDRKKGERFLQTKLKPGS